MLKLVQGSVLHSIACAIVSGNGDYDGIRLVNFVRRQVTEGVSAASIIERVSDLSSSIWTDDTLLVPVLESDPLLYCLEADEEDAAAAADVGVDPTLRVVGVRIAETK